MTKKQTLAVKCAYADLVGALQARNQHDIEVHTWDSHKQSMQDLEEAFDFIVPVTNLSEDDEEE